jgi:hypothetical protein
MTPVVMAQTCARANTMENNMSWLDALKKEVGDFNLSDGKKIKAIKQPTSPRDNVIKLINDNISYLNDNNYVVKSAKGRSKKPDSCFEIAEGKARVWLSYSRQKLKLEGDNSVIEGLADNKVITTLNHLRQAVESGVFDNQLEDIKSRRSAAQKASKVRAPKK